MVFDKQSVIDHISQVAGSDQAQQALQSLPDQVDTELHGDILQKLGVDPQQMVSQLGGELGGKFGDSQLGSQLGNDVGNMFGGGGNKNQQN
ncbi:MAG TPA: hypothetical protein VIA06_12270 [Candidatus Dormibacteraeota bacterium]|jgi:hypothetical protein|nr:hypothetical protein [Candidatus Dormibacteraeota bacterium]